MLQLWKWYVGGGVPTTEVAVNKDPLVNLDGFAHLSQLCYQLISEYFGTGRM